MGITTSEKRVLSVRLLLVVVIWSLDFAWDHVLVEVAVPILKLWHVSLLLSPTSYILKYCNGLVARKIKTRESFLSIADKYLQCKRNVRKFDSVSANPNAIHHPPTLWPSHSTFAQKLNKVLVECSLAPDILYFETLIRHKEPWTVLFLKNFILISSSEPIYSFLKFLNFLGIFSLEFLTRGAPYKKKRVAQNCKFALKVQYHRANFV